MPSRQRCHPLARHTTWGRRHRDFCSSLSTIPGIHDVMMPGQHLIWFGQIGTEMEVAVGSDNLRQLMPRAKSRKLY